MFRHLSFFILFAGAVTVQAQSAVVDGTVIGERDSLATAHALVRLQSPAGDSWTVVQQRITNANGRFYFANVSPGNYRVQLLRIGFEPVASSTVRIEGSGTTHVNLSAPARPVVLATMNVYANPVCLNVDRLSSDARLSELWAQARTAVETRHAFEQQYSFRRTLKQEVTMKFRVGGRKVQKISRELLSTPDSVGVRDERRQARNRTEGYGSASTLTLPDEKEVLNDAFLKSHCLETTVEEGGDGFALAFRPISVRHGIVDVRGRVWIDPVTYQVRHLDVGYLRDGKEFGTASVEYRDIAVEGKPMRMPGGGTAHIDPSGVAGIAVKDATATFAFIYDRIQPAAGSASR